MKVGGGSLSIYDVHRSTAMQMLTSPHIPRGAKFVDAVHPIRVATTVKVASTKVMADAFRSLMEFDPATVDDIAGVEQIYRRIGDPAEVYANMAITIAEGVRTDQYWAMAFSDGMRAINSAIEFRLQPGDEIIVSKPLYGCTDNYFSHLALQRGFVVKYVDLTKPEAIRSVLSKKTRVVYFETEANPNLRVYDLEEISAIVKAETTDALVIVDNTFPSPAGCNPLRHGADIVVHSATKALGGFSQEMAGFVVLPKKYWMQLFLFRKDTGGVPAPEQIHNLLTRGLPSLYDRFIRMQHNAQMIARYLVESGNFQEVDYPDLQQFRYHDNAQKLLTGWDGDFAPGFMIAFVPNGRTEAARTARSRRLVDFIARWGEGIITHAVSLGGNKSLIEMPFLGTHATVSADEKQRWGVDGGLIRLSVGLAHYGDQLCLLEDAINRAYRRS